MSFDNWSAGLHDLCDECEKKNFCYEACTRVQIKIDKSFSELQKKEFRNKEYKKPDNYDYCESCRQLRKY